MMIVGCCRTPIFERLLNRRVYFIQVLAFLWDFSSVLKLFTSGINKTSKQKLTFPVLLLLVYFIHINVNLNK